MMPFELNDSRVDKISLEKNKKRIEQLKNKIKTNEKNNTVYSEAIKDIESELCCGKMLLRIKDISNLEFSETPDIIITLNEEAIYGVEVKRIQIKPEDIEDEKRMENNFVCYGAPRLDSNGEEIPWSKYVTDIIIEKSAKKYTTEKTILFIDSHSPNEIEKHEIEIGVLDATISKNNKMPFEAIIYKTQYIAGNKTDIIFLNQKYENTLIYNSIIITDYFNIKYICKGKIITAIT